MIDETAYSCVKISTPEGVFQFPFAPKFLALGIGDAIKLNGQVYCFDGCGSDVQRNGATLLYLSTTTFDNLMKPRRLGRYIVPPYVTVHKLEELLS